VAHNFHGNNKYYTAKTKVSWQYQIPHGKTKNLTAISNSSRQNQKPHGKTKNLTAKPNRTTGEVINTVEVTSSFPVPTY